ncbi:MAG: TIGR01777 family oxidoreductase [Myxococcota bacterium]
MRILVTGGSGFIGGVLIDRCLARGDRVTAFTRRVSSDLKSHEGLRWVKWEAESEGEWQKEIAGQDAIVHLAGASAVGRRFTAEVRREITESRVVPTKLLVEGIGKVAVSERPRVFVCASGVGFYGPRGDEEVDEWAEAGRDFLAEVCVEWEDAARGAERHGVRVVHARFGFVLGRGGGALARLEPIFKAFVGGKLGSGQQWQPWVHVDDVVGAMLHAISEPSLIGPMNVVAPNPVRNAEFSRALGKALGRPALLPAPSFALRALFGEGAEPMLTGQRAVPRALLSHGYAFRFVDLDAALKDLFDGR